VTSPTASGSVEGAGKASGRSWRLPVERAAALGDQVLSGLSNFLAVAVVARGTDPEEFGHFAVAYAVLIALLTVARQLWGTRVAMTATPAHALGETRRLLGAIAWAAPAGAVLLVLASVAVTGPAALPVIGILALALPVVAAQDLCRYAAIAAGRPLVAVASDGVWVLVVVAAYALRPTIVPALLFWLGGAFLALLVASVALRVAASMSQGWAALRRRHKTSEVNALSAVSFSIATYIALGLATLTVGSAAAGSLRGASTLMAPVNSLFAFVSLALLPVAYRTATSRLPRLVVRVALFLLGLSAAWGALLLVAPDMVGRLVLGDTWSGARSVLPFTVIEYLGLAVTLGVALGLQAAQEARRLAVVTLAPGALAVAATLAVAGSASSARTFALALAVASVISAALAVGVEFRASTRKREPSPGAT
jgi:O-antigen/teichoic acid export membrane protein